MATDKLREFMSYLPYTLPIQHGSNGSGPDPGHLSVRLSAIREEMKNKAKLRYRGDYT
jgi:hypothetical protein